jgi:hypothetical protein
MEAKIAEFNSGKQRKLRAEYRQVANQRRNAKKRAQKTGDWTAYKWLTAQMLATPASDPQDPDFRRMTYCRYADDFVRHEARYVHGARAPTAGRRAVSLSP